MKQFGSFIFDSEQSRLLRKDSKAEVEIDHKLFELLALFIQQPNTIISRQTLLNSLWAGSIVTDNAINKLVANLRKVLGDDAKQPQYIQTVPKRGYRLICQVTLLASPTEVKTQHSSFNPLVQDKNLAPSNKKRLITKSVSYSFASLFLAFVIVYFWQAFSDKKNLETQFSVALTRASGAEQSAHMHPDNQHLYYLKTNEKSTQNALWIKNIHNSVTKQADVGKARISAIVALIEGEENTTTLVYFDKSPNSCGVYQAVFLLPSYTQKAHNKLFDCADKRIKDIDYNAQQHTLYYSAQPKNFWPNQVYAFNLSTKKHILVSQAEPQGWGHHNIDVSPDGNKLLIMSTNNDYKTQALSLDLNNNQITEGVKFNYSVTEAIWHHDSEQIYYYAAAPAQQIMRSEFNGDNATLVVSVSEALSSKISRLPDGKNILFSTEQKNVNNRWLKAPSNPGKIDNSTVDDKYPGLFHHSQQYLFISNRSGRNQLYLAHHAKQQAKIVTNFSEAFWLGYLVVAADDKSVLLNVDNKIYQLSINQLNPQHPLSSLADAQLIYTSHSPVIALDWLSADKVSVTAVNNANPELVIINLADRTVEQLQGQWAYGITDSQQPQQSYLIEQQSHQLYRANSIGSGNDGLKQQQNFVDTQLTLPKGFYHVKVDANTLYYVTTENDHEYLHAVSLANSKVTSKYRLHGFSSYDVSKGNILLSDTQKLEGDVFRTLH